MSVTITYFVHSTTTDNEQKIATGWLSGELSEAGKKQAKELGNQVDGKAFDVMYCSDLKRAIDSAELGFKGKCPIIWDVRLRECNYGVLNGTTKPFKHGLVYYVNEAHPSGESYLDVERRISELLADIKKQHDGKRVAFMAHEAPQLALEVILNGKTWDSAIAENWRNVGGWQPGWTYRLM